MGDKDQYKVFEVTNDGYSFFEVPRRRIGFRSLKPRKPSKERIESLLKYPLKSPTSDTVAENKVNFSKRMSRYPSPFLNLPQAIQRLKTRLTPKEEYYKYDKRAKTAEATKD